MVAEKTQKIFLEFFYIVQKIRFFVFAFRTRYLFFLYQTFTSLKTHRKNIFFLPDKKIETKLEFSSVIHSIIVKKKKHRTTIFFVKIIFFSWKMRNYIILYDARDAYIQTQGETQTGSMGAYETAAAAFRTGHIQYP